MVVVGREKKAVLLRRGSRRWVLAHCGALTAKEWVTLTFWAEPSCFWERVYYCLQMVAQAMAAGGFAIC